MMRLFGWAIPLVIFTAGLAQGDTVIAVRTIASKTLIGPDDIAMTPKPVPGALSDAQDAIGKETRYAIYAGRPIRAQDLAPPALIERNTLVTLVFMSGGLHISTEGRALDRAAIGDAVRVLNIGSRQTIVGRVAFDGRVIVQSAIGG